MASNALKRFVGGFALTTLDQIQKREAYEREIEKEKMLQKLRTEQAKDLANYQDLLERKRVSKDLSTPDYETGKRILRDADGNKIGEIDVPASDKVEYEASKRKAALDEENVRTTVASRARDDARQDRSTNAYISSLGRGGRKGSGGLDNDEETPLNIANELMYRYKTEVDEAVKSNNISESAVRQAAIALVKKVPRGDVAQEKFLEFLNNYRTGRKATYQRQRTLDSVGTK